MTISINGSGTITGLSAGGLPDATVQTADIVDANITQSKLAANVAGNGPAFSAYQSSAQTISSATVTKLQFQTEEWDTNDAFNNTGSTVGSTPAYAFRPTVAGYYAVTAGFQVSAVQTYYLLYLYKNGSNYKYIQVMYGSQSGLYGSCQVYLNGSTDYIDVYAYLGTGQALSAGSPTTYFQASLVRAA